jgi:hypothetical protein
MSARLQLRSMKALSDTGYQPFGNRTENAGRRQPSRTRFAFRIWKMETAVQPIRLRPFLSGPMKLSRDPVPSAKAASVQAQINRATIKAWRHFLTTNPNPEGRLCFITEHDYKMLVKNQEKITFILNVILFGSQIAQAQFLGKAASSSGPSTWHLSIFEPPPPPKPRSSSGRKFEEIRTALTPRANPANRYR